MLSRSVAFSLKNDVSKEIDEIKKAPPENPVSSPTTSASSPEEHKTTKQIQREKKVIPIPRQVSFMIQHFPLVFKYTQYVL